METVKNIFYPSDPRERKGRCELYAGAAGVLMATSCVLTHVSLSVAYLRKAAPGSWGARVARILNFGWNQVIDPMLVDPKFSLSKNLLAAGGIAGLGLGVAMWSVGAAERAEAELRAPN